MQCQDTTSKVAVRAYKKTSFESIRKEDQGHTQYANSSSRRIYIYLGWFLYHILWLAC